MNKGKRFIFRITQVVAMVVLVAIMAFVLYQMIQNPSLFSAEGIESFVSKNKYIACLEFVALYLLKGISFVFPSAVLNVASGIVFGFPYSVLVCSLGIFIEFISLYFVGILFGADLKPYLESKYQIIQKISEFHSTNGIFISFIIRIMGIVSYDVGSLYLGIMNVSFFQFIVGSMAGAFFNILLSALFGKYMFSPFSWQMWIIVLVRICAIFLAYVWKKRCRI